MSTRAWGDGCGCFHILAAFDLVALPIAEGRAADSSVSSQFYGFVFTALSRAPTPRTRVLLGGPTLYSSVTSRAFAGNLCSASSACNII